MIVKTERSLADKSFEKIKEAVKLSGLDYCIRESAYTVDLKLRKRYLTDYSHQIFQPESTPVTLTDQKVYSFPFPPPSLKNTKTQTEVIENSEAQNKTIVNLKKQISQLEESNATNDKTIDKIQTTLAKVEEGKDELKKEKETKTYQLKQKNKVLEATKMNLERLTEKHENMEISYQNKIKKLDKKLESLGSELAENVKNLS